MQRDSCSSIWAIAAALDNATTPTTEKNVNDIGKNQSKSDFGPSYWSQNIL